MSLNSYKNVDREALAKDLNAIHQEVLARVGEQDFQHLKKMERWIVLAIPYYAVNGPGLVFPRDYNDVIYRVPDANLPV